jgi:hypothetical protein
MERDLPIVRSKWVDIYVGLFGPTLTYHTSGYDDDKARLVISLFLLKLYITLPWKHRTKSTYEFYATYGFYTSTEPDRFIFQWGDYYKTIYMPWNMICVKMRPVDIYGDVIDYPDTLKLNECPDIYLKHGCLCGYEFDYWVEKKILRPNIFKKLKCFDKEMYEVHVTFKGDLNGYKELKFTIPQNICVLEHINVHILSKLPQEW